MGRSFVGAAAPKPAKRAAAPIRKVVAPVAVAPIIRKPSPFAVATLRIITRAEQIVTGIGIAAVVVMMALTAITSHHPETQHRSPFERAPITSEQG